MMTHPCVLAIDQGTTNTKALLLDERGEVVARASRRMNVSFPAPGWVEQDAELATKYARAREIGYKAHADAIIEIADQADDPNKARVQIDARKWILAKMLPKVYGERIEHEHKGGITVNLTPTEARL